jgi:beta-glucanase (GH16 family)
MKKILFTTFFITIVLINLYSQTYLRTENPKYSQTVYFEDFNLYQNFINRWTPISHELGGTLNNKFYIWVDSTSTVNINENSSRLELSALYSPGYTTTMWASFQNPDSTIIEDYIAGQVQSIQDFPYGVFECNAKFNYKKGAFPAFWLYNDTMCFESKRPEIDIVEMKYDDTNPTYDNNIFYYPYGCGSSYSIDFKETGFNWSTENTFTFKCVWSPNKIEFWVDNELKHTTYQIDHPSDYPDMKMHIRLSQQLWPYKNKIDNIDVPQTSYFNWVKVKEFFLAPEITCPTVICSADTAAMDVDPSADSITWSLMPTNLFSGTKTGTGKNAIITAAYGASGEGKIIYSFKMPSGEYFTAEKSFTVGVPNPAYIDFVNIGPNYPGSMVLCDDMPNDGKVTWNGAGDVLEYSWSVYDDGSNYWQVNQHPMIDYPDIPMEDVQFSKPYGSVNGWVNVKVKARNKCDGWGEYKLPALQFSTSSCYNYYLNITPNPASGETVLTIENQSEVKSLDENAEWEFEVYDPFQSLKEKKTKLKGNEHKIQTAGWKEGVYIVRVKYNNEILQGKLVVKR